MPFKICSECLVFFDKPKILAHKTLRRTHFYNFFFFVFGGGEYRMHVLNSNELLDFRRTKLNFANEKYLKNKFLGKMFGEKKVFIFPMIFLSKLQKKTNTHTLTRNKFYIRAEQLNVKTNREILPINLHGSGLLKSKKKSVARLMNEWILFCCYTYLTLFSFVVCRLAIV